MIQAVPLELKQANAFVDLYHRHHQPVVRDKYRIGASVNGKIVGVVQVARPKSGMLDDGKTLEVVRLCTDGSKDVCSFLYSRAARVAKELGYSKIITYILDSEDGTSLKATGWHFEAKTTGGTWNRPSRNRTDKHPVCPKQRWAYILEQKGKTK